MNHVLMKEFQVLVAVDQIHILHLFIEGLSPCFFVPCPLVPDRCTNWNSQTTLLQNVSELCSPFLKRNLSRVHRCAVAFGDPFEYVMLDLEELNECWKSKQEFLNPLDFKTYFPDATIKDLVILLKREYTSIQSTNLLKTIQMVQEVSQIMLERERQIKRWARSLAPEEATRLEMYLKSIFTATMIMRGGGIHVPIPLQVQSCRPPSPNQEIALSTLLCRVQEWPGYEWPSLPLVAIGLGGICRDDDNSQDHGYNKEEVKSNRSQDPDVYMEQLFASAPASTSLPDDKKNRMKVSIQCPTVTVRLSSMFNLQHEMERLCTRKVCCRESSQALAQTSGHWLELLFDIRPCKCPLICIENWC